ncbi:MAG: endonuclease Q family protein, partial [Parcubacteria group bacterium]
ELHSRFARAVSKDMNLETLEAWGIKKGIDIIGTGDFTHPTWFAELKDQLEEAEPGLYKRKGSNSNIRFLLSAEISCIYTQGGRGRRVHILLYAPTLAAVEKISAQLGWQGNLKSDGRPIIGISCKELAKIVLNASPECLVIPAHVWTPWFGLLGSMSGFDSLQECFEEITQHIPAIETGLSSDPPMNWRIQELDNRSIVSFSDAHSPANIGREATVFELKEKSYQAIVDAIRQKNAENKIDFTIEFYPEEGMYHWDGHRNCEVRWSPAETKKYDGICPKCGKRVTVGVMNRVDVLASRPEGFNPSNRPGFKSLVPLREIIGEAFGVGKASKSVKKEYDQLVVNGKSEFNVLLNVPENELKTMTQAMVAEGIKRVREGKLQIIPGYDGTYGIIKVFSDKEREKPLGQSSLF